MELQDIEQPLVLFTARAPIKLGELYRYKVEYTPDPNAHTRRQSLWVYVRNLEMAAFRAAYLHGPYSLYIDMRPGSYDELKEINDPEDQPKYDINVRAGQSFHAELKISGNHKHVWTIDVVGEQLFSKHATINHQIKIATHKHAAKSHSHESTCDVDLLAAHFSVNVQDTASLWMHPLPRPNEPLHLCVLTHGLVSNVTSDLLFLKESIDRNAISTGENIICRGFVGNVAKTEKGVKKLGRRLADWLMFELVPAYKPAKMSFVAHSLGGLVQSYALGYIHSVNPRFFDNIELENFVALATPFLGISTENPGYVKMFLDFGIVGKTGRDLGLSWTAGTKKPLLQTLPTGPAHEILQRFKKRTIYANSVNDGIVPLRTSSLLYLDWRALVKSAAAEHGDRATDCDNGEDEDDPDSLKDFGEDDQKPERRPSAGLVGSSPIAIGKSITFAERTVKKTPRKTASASSDPTPGTRQEYGESNEDKNFATLFFDQFSAPFTGQRTKIMSRTQTRMDTQDPATSDSETDHHRTSHLAARILRKTTLLEAGMSLLNPPHPDEKFITHPSSREDVIFHDRVYHEQDLPPRRYKTAVFGKPDRPKEVAAAEEKMARQWHHRKTWRKVLVQLQAEAHNNIIVRRRFSNAYGWPVIRHVVANHFSLHEPAAVDNDGSVQEVSQKHRDYSKKENKGRLIGAEKSSTESQHLPSFAHNREATTDGTALAGEPSNGKSVDAHDLKQNPDSGLHGVSDSTSQTETTSTSADSDVDQTWFDPSDVSSSTSMHSPTLKDSMLSS